MHTFPLKPRAAVLILAMVLFCGCSSGPVTRSLGAHGFGEPARAEGAVQEQALAVRLAQSGMPRKKLGLAYVYQDPGIHLSGETVTLNGSSGYTMRTGRYLVWEVEPGTHLLEAWRGDQRLASRAITVRKNGTSYTRFATKNNMGGLLYLQPAGPLEGSAFVRNSAFVTH